MLIHFPGKISRFAATKSIKRIRDQFRTFEQPRWVESAKLPIWQTSAVVFLGFIRDFA
jgi:hypothetical protein